MLFHEFPLNKFLLQALDDNQYLEATKIQEEVIKAALEGKNIVGQSQTGTGKTAAFVIPLLEKINSKKRAPQAIILAPTRELAMQIRDEVFKLSTHMFIKSIAVYGGSNIRIQRENLSKGPQIVVATPGRLIDLIDRGYIDCSNVEFFVLDEVDRMLDMGFVEDIDYVWSRLPTVRQSMTFSATIPAEMQNLITKFVGNGYEQIKATSSITVDKIDHSFVEVTSFNKFDALRQYVDEHKDTKTIVFCRTKHECEHLSRMLSENGYSAAFLHGDLEQRARTRALKSFKDGDISVFVTTDVAARGLNMNSIELVINYHVPEDPESYIHRIGRTGRAGASGRAVMFVDASEKNYLRNIERRNKIRIKQVDLLGNVIERDFTEPRSPFGSNRSRHGGRGGYQGRRHGGGGGWHADRAPRTGGERPAGGYQGHRDGGDRPARPARDYGDRPSHGDRPARNYSDRPARDYSDRAPRTGGERPTGGYQGHRDGGDRPARPARDYGDRPSHGDRPARSHDGDRGGRGGYNKGPRGGHSGTPNKGGDGFEKIF